MGRSGEHENEAKLPCGICQMKIKGISALNDRSDLGHLQALKVGCAQVQWRPVVTRTVSDSVRRRRSPRGSDPGVTTPRRRSERSRRRWRETRVWRPGPGMSSGESAVISQPGDQGVLSSHNVSMIQASASYWLQSATVPAAVGHQHHHVRDIIECG